MERSSKKIYELGKIKEANLVAFGSTLGKNLSGGEILLLFGDLGAGKTTFVKGIAGGMEIDIDLVRSPTFTLVNTYPGKKLSLIHADLYRLTNPLDIYELDLLEQEEDSVVAIEWPGDILSHLDGKIISIMLNYVDDIHRELSISIYDNILENIIETTIDEWKNIQGGI